MLVTSPLPLLLPLLLLPLVGRVVLVFAIKTDRRWGNGGMWEWVDESTRVSLVSQLVSQAVSQAVNQAVSQAVSQAVNQLVSQLVNQPVSQAVNQLVK